MCQQSTSASFSNIFNCRFFKLRLALSVLNLTQGCTLRRRSGQRNNSWCYDKRSSLFCLRLLSLLFPSTDPNKRSRSIIDSFTGSSRVSKSFEQTSSPSKRYMGEGTIGLYLLLRRRWSKLLSRTESLWSDCKLSTLSRYSAGSSAGI